MHIFENFEKSSVKSLFKAWHLIYNKKYSLSSDEAKYRYKIFKENLKKIEEYNSYPAQLNRKGLGPFSDLLDSEFEGKYIIKSNLFERNKLSKKQYFLNLINNDNVEEKLSQKLIQGNCVSIDYRNQIPGIKNQGDCKASWAFSVVTAVENDYFKKNQIVIDLSEQYLIDCDFNDNSCQSGNLFVALQFIRANQGLPSTQKYPYIGSSQICQGVTSTLYDFQGQINLYKNWLSTQIQQGIMICLVDAFKIKDYSGGAPYFDGPQSQGNHGVTVVGMACDTNGNSFYWVRNSWGPNWGNNGYLPYVYQSTNLETSISTNIQNIGISIS